MLWLLLLLFAGCAQAPPTVIPQVAAPPCMIGQLTPGGLIETPYGRRFVMVPCVQQP
jgi:hypothetical protein